MRNGRRFEESAGVKVSQAGPPTCGAVSISCSITEVAQLNQASNPRSCPTGALPPYQIRTSHRLAPGACLAWAVWVGGGYSFPFLLLAGETDLAGTDCGKAAASWSWQQARQPQFGSGRNFYRGHTAIVTRAPHRMLLNPSPRVVREPTARGKATPRRSSPRPGVTI